MWFTADDGRGEYPITERKVLWLAEEWWEKTVLEFRSLLWVPAMKKYWSFQGDKYPRCYYDIQSWDLQESIWKNGKYWECHFPYDHKHWSHKIKNSKCKRKEDFDHQNTDFDDLSLRERLDLRVLRHFYFFWLVTRALTKYEGSYQDFKTWSEMRCT